MAIYELDGHAPQLGENVYVADSAEVIGRVTLGENASVWSASIVRADSEHIRIGRNCNIQDACVLHADAGVPLTLEDYVSVGHMVMLHGCTVGEGSLIGIGAVVLNHARIGKNCLVGAGALVTEGKVFPDGSMILGSPAKAVKQLSPEQVTHLQSIARHYVENAARFRKSLKKIG